MKITRFEDIDSWKIARSLSQELEVAMASREFGRDPHLRRQLRDAILSTMANIAEGLDSGSDPEFLRFLKIARRSASEVQSHLYTALDRKCIPKSAFDSFYAQAESVRRLIGGFMRYLGKRYGKRSAVPVPDAGPAPGPRTRTPDPGPA